MDRAFAYEALTLRIENPGIIRHSLAVEAIMRKLAVKFDFNPDQWGLAGLLHDIDLERVKKNPELHSLMGAEILEDMSFDSTIVFAVRAHNPIHGIQRRRSIDKALFCSNAISILILEAAMRTMMKSFESVTVSQLLHLHYEKNFAVLAVRSEIETCKELDMSVDEFYQLAFDAVVSVRNVLGL